MLSIGDVVSIKQDYCPADIHSGDTGVVVFAFTEPEEGYEVEFLDEEGYTKTILTLGIDEVRVVYTEKNSQP
ncbi:MAG: DUF4926 domain-containing protein [Coriobacteriaceae bacterium]|nr:DUF4926 domain-containing protein [Coriobacteriaceae bacterium]